MAGVVVVYKSGWVTFVVCHSAIVVVVAVEVEEVEATAAAVVWHKKLA
jgi:hypothetical protein